MFEATNIPHSPSLLILSRITKYQETPPYVSNHQYFTISILSSTIYFSSVRFPFQVLLTNCFHRNSFLHCCLLGVLNFVIMNLRGKSFLTMRPIFRSSHLLSFAKIIYFHLKKRLKQYLFPQYFEFPTKEFFFKDWREILDLYSSRLCNEASDS